MGTGTAVNTGDTITAAKMNLKMEDARDLAALGILDQSGLGGQELLIAVSENLSADRTLTITVNDAARTIDLTGNLTLAAGFTTTVAAITLAADALGSSVTLPATGTLATLDGAETLTTKTLTSPTINGATLSGTLSGSVTLSGATLTLTGGTVNLTAGAAYTIGTTDNFTVTIKTNAVDKFVFTATLGQFTVKQTTADVTLAFSDPAAARTITFADPGGNDSVVYLAATQSLTNKTVSGGTLSGTLAGTPTLSGATLTLSGGTLNLTAGAAYTIGTTDNFTVTIKTNAVDKFVFTATLGQFTVKQTTGDLTLIFSDPGAARNITFGDPGGHDSVVYLAATQTLTNKTIGSATLNFTAAAAAYTGTSDNNTFTIKTNNVNKLTFSTTLGQFVVNQTTEDITLIFSDPAAARNITFGDPGGHDSVVYLAATQTLTNKTIGSATLNFTAAAAAYTGTSDNNTFTIKTNNIDKLTFSTTLGQFVVNQTTEDITLIFSDPAAARNITFADPGGHDSVVYLAATQSLSGKTISLTGNLTLAAALDIVIQAATAVALELSDGATKVWAVDTRVAVDNVEVHTWTPPPPTIASAAGSTWRHHQYGAVTVTLTGGTGVTAMDGLHAYFDTPTITSAAATTVSIASTIYIRPPVAAGGGPASITNNYMINTSVAGCFLTAAGVWTDASSREHKTDIRPVETETLDELIRKLDLVTYVRKDVSDGGFKRYGVIAEDAPDFLASPDHKGVSASYMAGFALAGLKRLEERITRLEEPVLENS